LTPGKENLDVPSSFRDPSGFLFYSDGIIYRQINEVYRADCDRFVESGLYASLTAAERLVPHDETDIEARLTDFAHKVIKPELIPFISYPYEWSFSRLKDAALATLPIQKEAFEFAISLKDCDSHNIQLRKGKTRSH
jgi:hypothetical protein